MSTDSLARTDRAWTGSAAQIATDLLASGSVEMSPDRVEDVGDLARLLPTGARVYVAHLPRHTLAQSHAALRTLRAAGLEPVAHIAARRLGSREELRSFLERAAIEAGLSKVLALGGDEPQPRGPYSCAADLLREETLARCGIREVAVAGYPEGHPRIAREVIEEALARKLAIAADQGLGAHIVTQFSFAPGRVIEYCAELARKFPRTPAYVGLAGPADARTLLRFAQRCGVSASLRGLRAQGMRAVQLITRTDPHEQLTVIARYCAGRRSCNVVGVHLFSFGGARKTAAWINQQITAQARP